MRPFEHDAFKTCRRGTNAMTLRDYVLATAIGSPDSLCINDIFTKPDTGMNADERSVAG